MGDEWILVEEAVGDDFLRETCRLCRSVLSVPYYMREVEDTTLFVHKACGDLPKEMKYKLHPRHKLIQLDKVGDSRRICKCCYEDGFPYYKCSDCDDFVVSIGCILKSFPVTHPCHRHQLTRNDFYLHIPPCAVCKQKQYRMMYECTKCSFQVHEVCVSSRIVKLPLHCHDVKFIYSLPAENHATDQLIYCRTCEQDMEEGDFAYHCARCRYFFHAYNCRPLEHFSHPEHPLTFVNEGADADSASKKCYCCGTKISAPYYYCNEVCTGFFLHKYCAELPKSMEHHLHPSHALTLSDDAEDNSKCNACRVPCQGLSYSCASASCRFNIDTICAMKTLRKHEFHEHRLFSAPTKASSACRACNLDSEGAAYQCATCRFWVHQHCASLPMLKKNYLHPHKLQLTYSLEESFPEYTKYFHCYICREEIQPHNWAYHCFRCRYFTHAHNCLDPNRDMEEFDAEAALAAAVHLPAPNEFVSLATLSFMDINQGEDEEPETDPRDLNGRKTRKAMFLDPTETCELCERFLAAPCNTCALCKYFLPKFPSDLKDLSLFEEFYSILKEKEEIICMGFVMSFLEGGSIIKISSSVLPRYVKHEGHIHVLTTTFIMEPSWCNACENDFQGYGFRCNFCNFTIDTYCALLPGSISHGSDREHGFKLTYYSIEDVEEYICEICEKDITTMWFYHCEECDYSIHPRCIWKIHIKFGPFMCNNYGDGCTLVRTNKFECSKCGEKESPGCRYSLFFEKSKYNDDDAILHQECYPFNDMRRWPTEVEELVRILESVEARRNELNSS